MRRTRRRKAPGPALLEKEILLRQIETCAIVIRDTELQRRDLWSDEARRSCDVPVGKEVCR
ncbi:hypothetical protein So717_33480 [Roseobacter cerasinus]|uniref:Uncharacterized protein n=1 Tax=Roseobacter cerasinus TaxID=2602289 RepID=A0A640VXC9_9RHOB|nr:hypothetical protein So717_33480 [Roseobacter cerasinus]